MGGDEELLKLAYERELKVEREKELVLKKAQEVEVKLVKKQALELEIVRIWARLEVMKLMIREGEIDVEELKSLEDELKEKQQQLAGMQ